MNNLLEQIKNYNPDLKESEISGLLYVLKNGIKGEGGLHSNNITNQGLVTLTGIPKETLKQFKKSISFLLENKSEDSILLSEKGRETLGSLYVLPYKWSLLDVCCCDSCESCVGCCTCEDRGEDIMDRIKEMRNKYVVDPKREFDQFLATPETVYSKSRILEEKGVINGKNIAFIGDDDLNSISLGLINSTYKSIVVFDVDRSILDKVKKASEEYGLKNIETVSYDVRKDLDQKYLGKFDVVVFDPPYTKSGVRLFLERSIELLGDFNGFDGKYIFMYYGNSFKSPEKILKIQEMINRYGLSIEDRIEKFARYTGADSIGNASSLYILKANKFTHALGFSPNNIYTFENQKEEKFPFVDHVVFKIFEVTKDITLSKNKLTNLMNKICSAHKLKVVDRKVTEFKGGGMTVTFVLSNSNIVVHTWPEFNAVHLDLITCSPIYKKEDIVGTVSSVFETSSIEVSYVE